MLGILYLIYFVYCSFDVLRDFYTCNVTLSTIIYCMFLLPQYFYLLFMLFINFLDMIIGKEAQDRAAQGLISGTGKVLYVVFYIITLPLSFGPFRFGRRK